MKTRPAVGDVVRINKRGNRSLIEVVDVSEFGDGDVMIEGRIPYRTTYTKGGRYEGSYRGSKMAWLDQVEEIVPRDAVDRAQRPELAAE